MLKSRSVEMSGNSSSGPVKTRFSGLKDALTGKLTLTVYPEGSENAWQVAQNEDNAEVETRRWIIHPRSRLR